MKILQINGVIHQGSTGAIVDEISDFVSVCGDECVIAYGIGRKVKEGVKFCYRYEQALYKRCSMILGYRYGFAPFSTRRLKKIIEDYKPDIIHLHSINGNCVNIYKLLEYIKRKQIATIITNHAEFFYTGNCTSTYGCNNYIEGCRECHNTKWASDGAIVPKTKQSWDKMKQAFSDFSNLHIVSVSEHSQKCSEKSPILNAYNHSVILNGINTEMFSVATDINIREKYNLNARCIAVFVASGFSTDKNHLKGGYWLIELAKRYKKEDFQFLVVGSDGQGIQQDNIVFTGQLHDSALLANIYSQADIALGFSKAESFGMTCAEALCCGTPYVGFKCGGTESIAIEEFTRFVEYGNLDVFAQYMEELIELWKEQEIYISDISKKTYSSKVMAKKYYELYRRLYINKKGD